MIRGFQLYFATESHASIHMAEVQIVVLDHNALNAILFLYSALSPNTCMDIANFARCCELLGHWIKSFDRHCLWAKTNSAHESLQTFWASQCNVLWWGKSRVHYCLHQVLLFRRKMIYVCQLNYWGKQISDYSIAALFTNTSIFQNVSFIFPMTLIIYHSFLMSHSITIVFLEPF